MAKTDQQAHFATAPIAAPCDLEGCFYHKYLKARDDALEECAVKAEAAGFLLPYEIRALKGKP